jgi:hypothetical protein
LQREKIDDDENLPNVNTTKHPTKKKVRKRYKMEGPKSNQKRKTTNNTGSQGEHEQIKYSNLSPLQGAYQIRRGRKKEHATNLTKEVHNTQSIT